MSAKIENGVLYINGLKVPIEHPINNFVEINGLVVLLLATSKSIDNNVIALDLQGNLKWRIEFSDFDLIPDSNYYSGIGIKDGKLFVNHSGGPFYYVDLKNGHITDGSVGRTW